MIKIKDSLKNGFKYGSKGYYSILLSYFPLYILGFILFGLNMYIPKALIFKVLYSGLVLGIYAIVRLGVLGIHYEILMNNNSDYFDKGFGKGIFNSFKLHLVSQNILMGFYKYIIGLIYIIIPIMFTYASIETGTLYKLCIILLLLYIPTIIILFYSYGFSQLLVYRQVQKGHYQTSGLMLHNCRILMQGNKLKYFGLQLILLTPRLMIATIIGLLSTMGVHLIVLNVLIGFISFILLTLIFIPYLICSKLSFYQQLI